MDVLTEAPAVKPEFDDARTRKALEGFFASMNSLGRRYQADAAHPGLAPRTDVLLVEGWRGACVEDLIRRIG